MSGPMLRNDGSEIGPAPQTAAAVRMLHRRRGWAWIAVGSVAGLCVYAVIGAHFFPNPAGAAGAINGLAVLALLALAVVGLIAMIVDTVRLRRLGPRTRADARGRTSHHPGLTHAYRYPPRHRFTWAFERLMLLLWIGIAVGLMPDQVNSWAYLFGAGGNAVFFPQAYGQDCGRSGCTTITNGFLASGPAPQVRATWPGQATLGIPFTVHAPVWDAWGRVQIVSDTTSAVIMVVFGLFLDLAGVVAVMAVVKLAQHWMTRRIQRRQQPAASLRGPAPG